MDGIITENTPANTLANTPANTPANTSATLGRAKKGFLTARWIASHDVPSSASRTEAIGRARKIAKNQFCVRLRDWQAEAIADVYLKKRCDSECWHRLWKKHGVSVPSFHGGRWDCSGGLFQTA